MVVVLDVLVLPLCKVVIVVVSLDFDGGFFKVGHLHCAGFKVACKHSQHLRSAGKTFGSRLLLKPSRAIPTQQCTSQIQDQEWIDMHKAIQLY